MNDATKTMPRLEEVLAELREREPIFHRPESGAGPADGERITEETFWEIGASGQRYSREDVLDTLAGRQAHPPKETWRTEAFECHPLAPGLYLLSYTLWQEEERGSRRTTLWRRTVDGWKAVFHQGTLLAPR
jgi:hypothetical protein